MNEEDSDAKNRNFEKLLGAPQSLKHAAIKRWQKIGSIINSTYQENEAKKIFILYLLVLETGTQFWTSDTDSHLTRVSPGVLEAVK